MPDAFTGTSALADQVKAAYDRDAFFALRAGSVYDQLARVKPGNVTNPGSSVSFLFWGDLTAVTAALSETVDIDAVALSDSLVTITPAEHGNSILTTIRIKTNTFLVGFDPDVANIVSYNMLDSHEYLAQEALESGATTTTVDAGAEASLTAGDVMTMNKLREQVAILRAANVGPIAANGRSGGVTAPGSNYVAVIHPHVSYDLMTATAGTDWAAFQIRQGGDEWYNGEVARLAGLSFIETSRAAINTDGGSSAVDTYSTYILGQDALGKAVSIPPHVVDGPITDKLRRFMPLGWHSYLSYGVIRGAAARNLIAASSIGANA
jgi:N4-gp56 family major capsid protein